MQKAGRLLHVLPSGGIGRFEIQPKLGQAVYEKSGVRIGNIVDIFGPVNNPYVRIKPASGVDLKQYVGKSLYV